MDTTTYQLGWLLSKKNFFKEKNNKRWQGRGKIGTPMYCW